MGSAAVDTQKGDRFTFLVLTGLLTILGVLQLPLFSPLSYSLVSCNLALPTGPGSRRRGKRAGAPELYKKSKEKESRGKKSRG